MKTKQLSWQTLVLQRVVAALELAGQKVGKVSWGFEKGDPIVAVQGFVDSEHELELIRARLSHVDGVGDAKLIGSTIYCHLTQPIVKELHVEGRLGRED